MGNETFYWDGLRWLISFTLSEIRGDPKTVTGLTEQLSVALFWPAMHSFHDSKRWFVVKRAVILSLFMQYFVVFFYQELI